MARICGQHTVSTDNPCAHRVAGAVPLCAAGHWQAVSASRPAPAPHPASLDFDELFVEPVLPAMVPADGTGPADRCPQCTFPIGGAHTPTCRYLNDKRSVRSLTVCWRDGCMSAAGENELGLCDEHMEQLRRLAA